ncbi:MAG: thioredoxin-dependent thiol peroxidase [Gemmatimonadota bacterium]|nr:thioredoxin-dependent thiol peroxidase [Gemmatimonadota bacterium]MDQ3605008.1 thioredoxin-dependent thiol peroxidase [Gemmatimonadota bacterium]
MLQENDPAPDFNLTADDGSTVRLSELRGRKVILYFYPRADTPGCTVEACEFRDALPRIEEEGAVVLGISPDPVKDLAKFRDKYDLNFRLLADEDHQAAEEYGVWKEKSMFGKKYMGVERSTFVIDEEGRIARAFHQVKPQGHAAEVLQEL